MNRLTRTLLALVLLLPSFALGASPATYTNAAVWLGDPSNWWAGSVGGALVANGEAVNNAETDISARVLTQATAGTRPIYNAADGSLYFAGGDRLTLVSSTTLFNSYHRDGVGEILLCVKLDGTAGQKYLAMNNNLGGTSNGFVLSIDNTTGIVRLRSRSSLVSPPSGGYNLNVAGDPITDTNWHWIRARFGPNASETFVQLDDGDRKYATGSWDATGRNAVDAQGDLYIGARSDGNSPANAYIRDLVMAAGGYFTESDVADWRARNAAYMTSNPGDSNLVVGKTTYSLQDFYQQTLEAMYYGKDGATQYMTVRGVNNASYQGSIFKIDPPNDVMGSGHTPGSEVLNSQTVVVDGQSTAMAQGLTLIGQSKIVFTRNTTFNETTLDLTSEVTLTSQGYREKITVTRLAPSDGALVGKDGLQAFFTASRVPTMNLFASFQADGTVVDTGDFDEFDDAEEYEFAAGTIAYAVFNPDNGIGLLTVLVDSGGLTPDLDVEHRTTDNKFHGYLQQANNIAAGTSHVSIWDSIHFEATEETFASVASSLVRAALGGQRRPRLSIGINNGLTHAGRPSAAQELLTAARAIHPDHFQLAP